MKTLYIVTERLLDGLCDKAWIRGSFSTLRAAEDFIELHQNKDGTSEEEGGLLEISEVELDCNTFYNHRII